jgi:hypothetical protein
MDDEEKEDPDPDDDEQVHAIPPSEEEATTNNNPRPWRQRFSAAVDRWYQAEVVPVLGGLKEVSLLNKSSPIRRRHKMSLEPYSPIRPPLTASGTCLTSLASPWKPRGSASGTSWG